MSHARTQVRGAVAALVTGLTTTGFRVFQSRIRPQAESSLPCLLVTANDEQVEASVDGILTRNLSIAIRGIAMGNSSLDVLLDQIALEVETAMAAVPRATFDRLEVDFDETLEKPVGSISLTYRTTVLTASGTPGVML